LNFGVLPSSLRPALIACALCASVVSPAPATAQAPPAGGAFHSAAAVRIDPGDSPLIDGDLSDPVWSRANTIEEFYQRQPNLGEPATERTVVRVLYDENNLYVGIYCYDAAPDQIAVTAMARDGRLFSSDTVNVILDPGLTRRNGYSFQVAASGGRRDTLLQNNADTLVEWDTLWDAKVQLVPDGWVIEYVIPFRSISYQPGQTDWGFEVVRAIRHKSEDVVWSSYIPMFGQSDISAAGTLTGLEGIRRPFGLDVQVYGTARYRHDWNGVLGNAVSGTVGGNAYYKITPALTGTLTVNPDFSDSPLDTRQVNTTRFSLFRDETRDFFLQDAAAFEFGGRNFANENNGRPFFSRNIGLVNRVPVSIKYGGKLSGELAGFGIGALSVRTADSGVGPGQWLSVARIVRPVLAESRIGMIVTNGDPTGATSNTLVGGDFQYRNSNFFGDQVWVSDFFYARTFSDDVGADDSFGVGLQLPNEPWAVRANFRQIGRNFDPALGFANRTGIRKYDARVQRRWRLRESFLRTYALSAEGVYYTTLNNHLESRLSQVDAVFETRSDDSFWIYLRNNFESVPEDFDLPREVPILAGDYNWSTVELRLQTSPARVWRLDTRVTCCQFYNGDGIETRTEVTFVPNQYFEFRPVYEGTFIRLPTGDVDIHVLSMEGAVNFTPDMQLLLEAQWDNISENFTFAARYRWEYSPGNEIFAAFGQTAFIPTSPFDFDAQTSLFTLRFGRTFQY
jgi:hypothetical protein